MGVGGCMFMHLDWLTARSLACACYGTAGACMQARHCLLLALLRAMVAAAGSYKLHMRIPAAGLQTWLSPSVVADSCVNLVVVVVVVVVVGSEPTAHCQNLRSSRGMIGCDCTCCLATGFAQQQLTNSRT